MVICNAFYILFRGVGGLELNPRLPLDTFYYIDSQVFSRMYRECYQSWFRRVFKLLVTAPGSDHVPTVVGQNPFRLSGCVTFGNHVGLPFHNIFPILYAYPGCVSRKNCVLWVRIAKSNINGSTTNTESTQTAII